MPAAPATPIDTSVPSGPGAVVGQVVGQVVGTIEQVARVVRADAAVAVAAEFTFPLALAIAVLGYLIVQGYVDKRDPKLLMAPQSAGETFVEFRMEDQL